MVHSPLKEDKSNCSSSSSSLLLSSIAIFSFIYSSIHSLIQLVYISNLLGIPLYVNAINYVLKSISEDGGKIGWSCTHLFPTPNWNYNWIVEQPTGISNRRWAEQKSYSRGLADATSRLVGRADRLHEGWPHAHVWQLSI